MPIFFQDEGTQIEGHKIARLRLQIDRRDLMAKLEQLQAQPGGPAKLQALQRCNTEFRALQKEAARLDFVGGMFGYDAPRCEPAPPRF